MTLSIPSTQTVTVDYAGGGEWGTAGTLTFAPGETSRTISIWSGPDDDDYVLPLYPGEPRQVVQVILSNASPNARILDGEGIGTVGENDIPFEWYQIFFATYVDPNQVTWDL